MSSGISAKNRQLLDELNRTQHAPFTAADVAKLLGLSVQETSHLLTYFAKKQWLSRVRRGLYLVVPLGTKNPKDYTENPWIIAQSLFAPCYIAGWSAAEYWGFTEQIFNSVVIITTQPQRKTITTIKGTKFIVKTVNTKYFGHTITAWVDNVKVFVADPSQTIADILDDPQLGGGIRHIADIVVEYFASKYREDEKLSTYLKKKRNKTCFKRLGFLLEKLEIKDSESLQIECKKNKSTGFTLLDSSADNTGSYNTHWNLRINVRLDK